MREFQERLDAQFQNLRDSREGPIFFVEHGLSEGEMSSLLQNVSQALNTHQLEENWWGLFPLPPVVVAAEIGYEYRGTGTDFWSKFNERLALNFPIHSRKALKQRFERAAQTYRGASPPETPWTENFHIIAWPITHALLPREFHAPLSETLTRLNLHVETAQGSDLHRALWSASRNTTRRYATLLSSEAVIVPLVRQLLGLPSSALSDEIIQRIQLDIGRDKAVRRNLATAQGIQRNLPNTAKRGRPQTVLPTIQGQLRLRLQSDGDGDRLQLEARFPAVDRQDERQMALRETLRRRRFTPCLWGSTSPVKSADLFSGSWFPLTLKSLPDPASPLFPRAEVAALDLEKRQQDDLARLSLSLAPTLLFARNAENDAPARQVLGDRVSGFKSYYLLFSGPNAPPSLRACPHQGALGPYSVHLLDPERQEHARTALSRLHYNVYFTTSLVFGGAPPLSPHEQVERYLEGDSKTFEVLRAHPGGVTAGLGGAELSLEPGALVKFAVARGEQTLTLKSPDSTEEVRFQGLAAVEFPTEPLVAIEALSPDLTIQEFLSERLTFQVTSTYPLQGLELTVELDAGGRTFGSSTHLDSPLPCNVGGSDDLWRGLLNNGDVHERLIRAQQIILRLRVGKLCAEEWTLEQAASPVWWEVNDGDHGLFGELGRHCFGEVSAAAPHLSPAPQGTLGRDQCRLLVPTEVDQLGPSAPFTTRCLPPSELRLGEPLCKKPKLVRALNATTPEVGLQDVVEAYLRWALAEPENSLALLNCRAVTLELEGWAVELCCGAEWARREKYLIQLGRLWEAFEERCVEDELGYDTYVGVAKEVLREVARGFVFALRKQRPRLWEKLSSGKSLRAQDFEFLDLTYIQSYRDLAKEYQRRKEEETAAALNEADVGLDPEIWESAFMGVINEYQQTLDTEEFFWLDDLAAMMIPTDTALLLVDLPAETMSLEELSEELVSWAKSSRRALLSEVPSRDELKAALALWLNPTLALQVGWQSSLRYLLSERCVARAVRYLALRHRQPLNGASR
jgi:hypothetical protein